MCFQCSWPNFPWKVLVHNSWLLRAFAGNPAIVLVFFILGHMISRAINNPATCLQTDDLKERRTTQNKIEVDSLPTHVALRRDHMKKRRAFSRLQVEEDFLRVYLKEWKEVCRIKDWLGLPFFLTVFPLPLAKDIWGWTSHPKHPRERKASREGLGTLRAAKPLIC